MHVYIVYADISKRRARWKRNDGADYRTRTAFSDRYSENLCARVVVVAVILEDVRRILHDTCSQFFYSAANSRRIRRPSRIGEIASAKLATKRLLWLVKPRSQNWFHNWKRYFVSEKVPRWKIAASIGNQLYIQSEMHRSANVASICISWNFSGSKNYIKNM